jgi:hypothetical protein
MNKKQGWFEPYILNSYNIDKIVCEDRPGVFVLGNIEADKKVKVKHISTSQNVKDELKKNLGRFHVFMYKPLTKHFNDLQNHQQTLQFA